MRIPFLDLARAHSELRDDLGEAARSVVARGQYILGEEVLAFEEEFAQYLGVAHCVGVNSGLDALRLALLALEVEAGDEVLVPANTYIATWLAVSHVGAVPVPVEPDRATYNIDPERMEGAITPQTRGVIAVHLYGQPAAMADISRVARQHGLWVLEDAAQAHGARYRGQAVGTLGDAGAWSFYPTKNLGALGDGGAVTTNDVRIAERVRLLRNYGSRTKNVHEIQGHNSRLDELQAAFLRVKLRRLDEWNARRREIAAQYTAALADRLLTPAVFDDATHAWHLFVVQSSRRDALREHLQGLGIEAQIHYPTPPYRQPAYAAACADQAAFPLTDRLHAQVLSLPLNPHLSEEEVTGVVEGVLTFDG